MRERADRAQPGLARSAVSPCGLGGEMTAWSSSNGKRSKSVRMLHRMARRQRQARAPGEALAPTRRRDARGLLRKDVTGWRRVAGARRENWGEGGGRASGDEGHALRGLRRGPA